MNKQTLKALKGSIKKWDDIAKRKDVDKGPYNCPLCNLFSYGCDGCPVAEKAEQACCEDTPYREWTDHYFKKHRAQYCNDARGNLCGTCTRIANREVKFLESLLPKKGKK